MIGLDTETTGLLNPKASDLALQPEIIEFAAIKYDADLNEIDRLEFLCRPKLTAESLPPIITKITGITWNDVKDQPPFEAYFKPMCEFFRGEEKLIAHNAAFDVGLMTLELRRMGMEFRFPWPTIHHCTVQMAKEIGGLGSKALGNLYEHFFQEKMPNSHRAASDVEGMMKVYGEMLKLGGRA